ncbi:MAG: hypothetical protein IJ193_08105 [Bacilli bacterium]|nr:hypothetical protein [Bacilli bacterium]
MKNIYVKIENNDNDCIWIKIIMNYSNELSLENVVMSINQMLINNRPMNVFFEYPNILFEKVNPITYVNNSELSKLKEITTHDHEASYNMEFTSYRSLKDAVYGLIGTSK